MADLPLILKDFEVRAIIAGTKTQKRIIMSPPPLISVHQGRPVSQHQDGIYRAPPSKFAVGDRLWVREPHYRTDDGHNERIVYAENSEDVREHRAAIDRLKSSHPQFVATWDRHLRVHSGARMPRWASRLTLKVTAVRVQHLCDISEDDAIAEGVYRGKRSGRFADNYASMAIAGAWFASACGWYRDLWERLHGDDAWNENPWVCAISFKPILANIDAKAEAANE